MKKLVERHKKNVTFAWKWQFKNGMIETLNVFNDLTVHGSKVRQLIPNESVRTLGIMMIPSLTWNQKFEMMRKKMHESVQKLMNTNLKTWLVHIYFHMYMIKSVFLDVE